jgi:outer membrane receptor protein involved in Fe transport
LRLNGLFVDTDRDEDETSVTFDGADLDFDGVEIQQERISQQTYSLGGDLRLPLGFAELGLAAGWSGYRENTVTTTFEGDNPNDYDDVEVDDEELLNIHDDEYTGAASLLFGRHSPFEFKIGIDLLHKERDGLNDGDFISGEFNISEDRYDPYARLTWSPSSSFTIDAGLRYEITRRDVDSAGTVASFDDETLNPSLNIRYAPSAVDQFRVSLARTVRRPDYDLISPVEEDESPSDGDVTLGNPLLRNQTAWGIDVGYERRLPGDGIFGVNAFYRDVSDLIELVNTGVPVLDDDDEQIGNVYEPRNIGDGEVWGIEFDLSTPLGFIGLPDTGVFANYTYLDSSTRDPFTGENRRFNAQPHHVYNVGFIQTLRSLNASFGATVSGRSTSIESNFDEVVRLRYNPDLEAFVEYRFNRNFLIRLSAQNLLDRTKREFFTKFDGDSLEEVLENRANGDIDEYELERERSGRLFQVTLRAAF